MRMFISYPKPTAKAQSPTTHTPYTVSSLSTPSHLGRSCQPGATVLLCVVSSGNARPSKGSMQFARGRGTGRWGTADRCCCLRISHITMAGCSTKVCAQQARVVVSKVEGPEVSEMEEEKRSEEKIRFLGHPRPTARLQQQFLVVQWKKRPEDLAEQQQERQQQHRRTKKVGRWSR